MTLKEHNRMALASARVDLSFGALALSKSPSVTQLLQRVNDSRRGQ